MPVKNVADESRETASSGFSPLALAANDARFELGLGLPDVGHGVQDGSFDLRGAAGSGPHPDEQRAPGGHGIVDHVSDALAQDGLHLADGDHGGQRHRLRQLQQEVLVAAPAEPRQL